MTTTDIVLTCVLSVVLGIPILMLIVKLLIELFKLLFVSEKVVKTNKRDFNFYLEELKNSVDCATKYNAEYESDAKAYLEKRIVFVRKKLLDAISAFSNEYGTTDSLSCLQDEFSQISRDIKDAWSKTLNGMNYYSSEKAFSMLNTINNEINVFISKAVVKLGGAKYNLRKYGQAVNNDNRRIFIVHGRNHIVRDEVRDFLKSKNFEPIILEYEVNRGQFVLEKFLSAASSVSYAIVLMTADDKVVDCDDNDVGRARQNVVLELGYFISQIGKERILILQDPNIENPSDINGLLYENLDDSDKWKERILKELYGLGYEKISQQDILID